jgi:hypothetical protein
MVAGKADTEPLFPDNPYMAPNRRVTITLMREDSPLPPISPPKIAYYGPSAVDRGYSPRRNSGIFSVPAML